MTAKLVNMLERLGRFSAVATSIASNEQETADEGLLLPGVVGNSEVMRRVCSITHMVARHETTVLITGSSGTGKEIVARAIHKLSPRRANPFVVINCAAIPESLLEAELFGFVKGSFTGAVQSRIGRIQAAHGGTLFLDEIGDMPIGLQSKMLRFLENGELQRIGASDVFRVDVRILAATNANLRELMLTQRFREDLYYRLAVFPIDLPPLKDRIDDLPSLVKTFLYQVRPHRPISISASALMMLQQHDWPGNVRELRNIIERACILVGDGREITSEHILV
jgi:transcriptional regulator with GAF, ATPase, and Fis domain